MSDGSALARFECGRCGMHFDVSAGACMGDNRAVVARYHRDGCDVRTRPWPILPVLSAVHPAVGSRDPVRVRIDVERGGESLSLWLDDEGTVVEYELG